MIFLLDIWSVPILCFVLKCSDGMLCFEVFRWYVLFWSVPTVYFVLKCSDGMFCFEMFRWYVLFWSVPTVCFVLKCSDGMFCFKCSTVCCVFYFIANYYYVSSSVHNVILYSFKVDVRSDFSIYISIRDLWLLSCIFVLCWMIFYIIVILIYILVWQ